MEPITTSFCQNETIIGKSENIIKDRNTNPYYTEYDGLVRSYSSLIGEENVSQKNKIIKLFLDLNIRVNSIINCKKEEHKNQTESNTELTKVINELSNQIEQFNQEKMETSNKMTVATDKNKNLDIYYVVYIMFIVLLIILQSSIVLFK